MCAVENGGKPILINALKKKLPYTNSLVSTVALYLKAMEIRNASFAVATVIQNIATINNKKNILWRNKKDEKI